MSTMRPDQPRPEPTPSADLIASALLLALVFGLYAVRLRDLQPLLGQFAKYPGAAVRLLQGGMDPERLLDYSPAYLGICALVARYLRGDFQLLFWFQLLLVAATTSGLFLLLRRHFGRLISLTGAAAFALYPGVMVYGGIFEPESLMMALLVLLLLCADSRTAGGSLAAGATLVLCLLTRPTFLLLALLVPAHLWLNMDGRRRAAAIGLFLLPVVASLPFLAARGAALSGSVPPPVMDPGVSFFLGNNPLASSTTPEFPPLVLEMAEEFPEEVDYDHAVFRLVARRETPGPLSHADTNRLWASRAIDFIRDEPREALRRLGRKLLFLFHDHRWHDLPAGHEADRLLSERWFPHIPMAVVSALAVAGLVAGLRDWRRNFLYYGALASQVASTLVTYTAVERLRLSSLPLLIVFAAVGVDRLRLGGKARLVALPAAVALFALFSRDGDLTRDNGRNWDNYVRLARLQAETFRSRDQADLAASARTLARGYAAAPWIEPLGIRPAGVPVAPDGLAQMALREFPAVRGDDPTARLDRATLLIEAGRFGEAERALILLRRDGHAFNRIVNRPSQPAYYLGRIAAARGRRAEAVAFMSEALTRSPGDPAILAQLSALTGDARYAAAISRYFGELSALGFLAAALLENGQPAEAAALLGRLVERLPEYRNGRILLAAALADAGRDEDAVAAYLEAARRSPEPILQADRILPAFRRLAERPGADGAARFRYALALRQFGRYAEARRLLRESRGGVDRAVVRKELETLEETMRRAGLE